MIYVAVCCSVLQCVAVCCSVLQCATLHGFVWGSLLWSLYTVSKRVCCSVLQCATMRCIGSCEGYSHQVFIQWARDCVAVCATLHGFVWGPLLWSLYTVSKRVCCNVLQCATLHGSCEGSYQVFIQWARACVAVCCRVLQFVALVCARATFVRYFLRAVQRVEQRGEKSREAHTFMHKFLTTVYAHENTILHTYIWGHIFTHIHMGTHFYICTLTHKTICTPVCSGPWLLQPNMSPFFLPTPHSLIFILVHT